MVRRGSPKGQALHAPGHSRFNVIEHMGLHPICKTLATIDRQLAAVLVRRDDQGCEITAS